MNQDSKEESESNFYSNYWVIYLSSQNDLLTAKRDIDNLLTRNKSFSFYPESIWTKNDYKPLESEELIGAWYSQERNAKAFLSIKKLVEKKETDFTFTLIVIGDFFQDSIFENEINIIKNKYENKDASLQKENDIDRKLKFLKEVGLLGFTPKVINILSALFNFSAIILWQIQVPSKAPKFFVYIFNVSLYLITTLAFLTIVLFLLFMIKLIILSFKRIS
ncbi:MAG: hypothetical protein C4539_13390 [Ignavibacteriales bacterium]|nr:MAG: hypothetical protein C4539_13390 [Ignavibacteriales bacterium]